jgi:hypothetical protein
MGDASTKILTSDCSTLYIDDSYSGTELLKGFRLVEKFDYSTFAFKIASYMLISLIGGTIGMAISHRWDVALTTAGTIATLETVIIGVLSLREMMKGKSEDFSRQMD